MALGVNQSPHSFIRIERVSLQSIARIKWKLTLIIAVTNSSQCNGKCGAQLKESCQSDTLRGLRVKKSKLTPMKELFLISSSTFHLFLLLGVLVQDRNNNHNLTVAILLFNIIKTSVLLISMQKNGHPKISSTDFQIRTTLFTINAR